MNVKAAICICLGFVLGGFVGAKFAVGIDPNMLRRVFGIAMLIVALKMIFSSFGTAE